MMELLEKIAVPLFFVSLVFLLWSFYCIATSIFLKRRASLITKKLATPEWRMYPYGGGAPIHFRGEKQAAIDHCAKTHGAVMFVDESHAMIFYKPFTSAR